MARRCDFIIAGIVLAAVVAGCSGPLKTGYRVEGGGAFKLTGPVTVLLTPYADLRGEKDPYRIGDIKTTVSDMTGASLVLDESVSALVTSAFGEELAASGFKVIPAGAQAQGADYVMDGEIRQFRLDIGPRDKISIEIFTSLKEKSTGRVVWSGMEKEEGERFAGVMGNSRRTINDYIVRSLSGVVRKTIKDGAASLNAGAPARSSPLPGKEPPETRNTRYAGESGKEEALKTAGALFVTTEPERAKVYIGDVYYGLSPVTIELSPGVYEVRLRLKGYKDENEKVAIRQGYKTEMEVVFTRE